MRTGGEEVREKKKRRGGKVRKEIGRIGDKEGGGTQIIS